MKTLCLDPSGNYKEGDGTTGWAIFQDTQLVEFGSVSSSDYTSQELYWDAVSNLMTENKIDNVVCESYKLFAHKAKQQSWSQMETPQLIGYLRMFCWHKNIPISFQDPTNKTRVADDILTREGVFEKKGNKFYCNGRPTNLHMRDAIRHGIYYVRYKKGK